MDITVIGMVKNSSDVIESYIRANGLFADRFVLIDNNSTDNTLEILHKLSDEGYKIDVFSDPENARFQSMKMNVLIRRVLSMYNTDWLIPLDDDEILFVPDGGNVRSVIENWDKDKAYFLSQRVYIPVESVQDASEPSVLKRITYAFGRKHKVECKIMFSSKTASEEGFLIVQGNHNFEGPSPEKIRQKEIMLAHYPVRSREQLISKALVGWTNYLATPFRKEGNGYHWKTIYDKYKSNMKVDDDLVLLFCIQYIDDAYEGNIDIVNEPLEIAEEGKKTCYTSAKPIDPMRRYIDNVENLAKSYAQLLQEKMDR